MAGIAVSRFGITVFDFYAMTPLEFHHACNWYFKDIQAKEEIKIQSQYELARWTVRHLWNMQGKVLRRVLRNVKEVEIFPWESQEEKRPQTLQEMKNSLTNLFNYFSKSNKPKRRVRPPEHLKGKKK